MATLTFLGTGNASVPPEFTAEGLMRCPWQSNLLLHTDSDQRIMLDCGTDSRFALAEQGLTHRDIDGVYISHIHADHCGGLEGLAFETHQDAKRTAKPKLWCAQTILNDLRRQLEPGIRPNMHSLEDCFNVTPLGKLVRELQFDQVCDAKIIPTLHIMGAVPKYSAGLLLEGTKRSIYWTSDTSYNPMLLDDAYRKADIILHDCELGRKSGNHAHLEQLQLLPPEIKGKMWLYHHNPALIPETVAKSGEFAGFAHKGLRFEL